MSQNRTPAVEQAVPSASNAEREEKSGWFERDIARERDLLKRIGCLTHQSWSDYIQLAERYGELGNVYMRLGRVQEMQTYQQKEAEADLSLLEEMFSHCLLSGKIPSPILDIFGHENKLLLHLFHKDDAGSAFSGYMGLQEEGHVEYAARVACIWKLHRLHIRQREELLEDYGPNLLKAAALFVELGHAYVDVVVDRDSASEMDIHNMKTAMRCILKANSLILSLPSGTLAIPQDQYQAELARLKSRIPPDLLGRLVGELCAHPEKKDLADLIYCYQICPEQYKEHIAYLEELQNLYGMQALYQEQDQNQDQNQNQEQDVSEKISISCKMVQAFVGLGEIYLAQHAAEQSDTCSMELAKDYADKANKACTEIAEQIQKTGSSISLLSPLYMPKIVVRLKERIKSLKKTPVVITDEMQLKKAQCKWAQAKEEQPGIEIGHLIKLSYFSGELEQYALQAGYLKQLAERAEEAGEIGCRAQATLLLSNAYSHLEQLDKAEACLDDARRQLASFRMKKGLIYDSALFEEMLETYTTQLGEGYKAQAKEQMEALQAEVAAEQKVKQAARQQAEEKADAELAAAIRLSLRKKADSSSSDEEKDSDTPSSYTYSLPRTLFPPHAAVGPCMLPGWIFEKASEERGESFYEAVLLELKKTQAGRASLEAIPDVFQEMQADYVRLCAERENFEVGRGADVPEIRVLACDADLKLVIAIIDTRRSAAGFTYYYADARGACRCTQDVAKVPVEGKALVRLACTGEQYLSVTQAPGDVPHNVPQPSQSPVVGKI